MISSNITGASAYAAIQSGLAGADAPGPMGGASFGSALQGAMSNLANLGHDADAKSVQAMTGGGNLTDVVMAVSKAEMALQASVAVRDKVISAYQDIMRMSV
jgi:flagellar hook-basal body complex protein FliE